MPPSVYSNNVNPSTTADVISRALIRLQRATDAYVHEQTISFKNGKTRDSWGKLIDKDYRGVFWELRMESFNIVKIAHFSNSTVNWVRANTIHRGQAEWDRVPWHCWAAAIIKRPVGDGVYLLIYDNDAETASAGDRCTDILRHNQQTLWRYLKERGPVEVHYCIDQSESETDLCLPVSMRRVRLLAAYGDTVLDVQHNDPRLENCVALRDS